jgi:hypothetical protein
MGEVGKRDRDREVGINEMVENPQTELEQAQVATISPMNNFVEFATKRPKPKPHNPKVSQASGNHQLSKSTWVRKMTLVQVETTALLVREKGFYFETVSIPIAGFFFQIQV